MGSVGGGAGLDAGSWADGVGARERLASVVAALPGAGEPRDGQARMAELVEGALRTGRPVAVQAGTGTGKSLGYLVPAISSGRTVVVVVSSILLQDQLATKDLPFLEAHHPVPFRWAVVKGRSNYLCLAACDDVRAELARRGGRDAGQDALFAGGDDEGADLPGGLDDGVDAAELERLLAFAEVTGDGDRASLALEPDPRAWAALSVSQGECPGAQSCPQGEACFAERARRRAGDAQVVVVNAHLYGADVALEGKVLPVHDVVIVDEAHDVEDALVGALSVTVDRIRLLQVRKAFGRLLTRSEVPRRLAQAADRLQEALAVTSDEVLAETRSARLVEGPRPHARLVAALVGASAAVEAAVADLRRQRGRVSSPLIQTRFDRALNLAGAVQEGLQVALDVPEGRVCWIERSRDVASLRIAETHIGALLRDRVWTDDRVGVLTSATLPEVTARRLGLPGDCDWEDVGSPFPYRESLLYVARHLPEPNRPAWRDAATDETLRLVEAAGGHALCLFTTTAGMHAAAAAARARLDGVAVLCQGEAPKARLVERFRDDPSSVLFATASFWQGIDVPGRALSLVVIDKLPFPVPTDPLVQARHEEVGEDRAFALVDLPQTAVRLGQAVGRLVRSSTDRGVVAVLDRRLATRSYRRDVLAHVPPLRRTVDPDEVVRYLQALTGPTPSTASP
ncbi:MAG: ATP-dependent DNA helicase [Acidimicrobiales bacterium]|jgi:ATP-dependent DNA helicase DinG|nr:ATP-dependent DNA helicase [Acidimicrobiales bacterium]